MLNPIRIGALAIVLASGVAQAQDYPPMDMSWGIQQQQSMWEWGQQSAQYAADMWMQMVTDYRMRTGYTGPINSPFNAMTIFQANNAANDAFYDYLHTTQAGQERLYNAYERYANEGILGWGTYTNPYTGETYQLQGNGYDNVWQGPDGQFYGSNGGWTPEGAGWTQLDR